MGGQGGIDVLDGNVPIELVPPVAALQAELDDLRQEKTRLTELWTEARAQRDNLVKFLDNLPDGRALDGDLRAAYRMVAGVQPE